MRGATILCVMLLAELPALAQLEPTLGTEEQREAGKVLYDQYCAQCHGDSGAGDGSAAPYMKPKPRDFTSGKYKFRTTPSGALPTDDDLMRVLREGLPYTTMPAWPDLNDSELMEIIYYIKSFSSDFGDPRYLEPPIDIPPPLALTVESIEKGRQIYQDIGCVTCHGELGRGDGLSAPTLADDWGDHIRAANMAEPWTYRGGATREDIFRTFSTGVNGTPMPSYFDTLEVEDRWHLTNYVYSLADGEEPNYAELVSAKPVEMELDLSLGDELFEGAKPARFPVIGQIVEPGRNFYPSVTSVLVDAVYSRKEIAIRVRWSDLRADVEGTSDPVMQVPSFLEDLALASATPEEEETVAAEETEDDFWDEGGFDDDAGAAQPLVAGPSEFSDALALQLPAQLPTGIRKPYFIFGDPQNPVDLWFLDLTLDYVKQFAGRGSSAITPSDSDDIEVVKSYDNGLWTVVYKRALKSRAGVTFAEEGFVPVAFSVWDGFNRERGNKRGLTQWQWIYMEPRVVASATGPMVQGALIAFVVEILIIIWLRRRYASGQLATFAGGSNESTAAPSAG